MIRRFGARVEFSELPEDTLKKLKKLFEESTKFRKRLVDYLMTVRWPNVPSESIIRKKVKSIIPYSCKNFIVRVIRAQFCRDGGWDSYDSTFIENKLKFLRYTPLLYFQGNAWEKGQTNIIIKMGEKWLFKHGYYKIDTGARYPEDIGSCIKMVMVEEEECFLYYFNSEEAQEKVAELLWLRDV